MRHTTHITIEHVVVSSQRSYEAVKASLEARMGLLGNTYELVRQVAAAHSSWGQVTPAIEKRLGASGFSIFSKVEQGQLLSLAGKPRQVNQYAIGNPLLEIQMIEHPRLPCIRLCGWPCMREKVALRLSPTIGSPRCFPSITGRKSPPSPSLSSRS